LAFLDLVKQLALVDFRILGNYTRSRVAPFY